MITPSLRYIRRIREIITVLIKYGLDDIITHSTLRNFVSERNRLAWNRRERPFYSYTRWERIRMACEELGPSFIKLAQVLSNRPDLLPEDLVQELARLQDNVEPMPFAEVLLNIERTTGATWNTLFTHIDEVPLASASIGQVHAAHLKSGEAVVIKVQRSGLRERIQQDIAILKDFVRRADRYLQQQGILNAQDVIRLFERTMQKELDYLQEARNMERFKTAFAQHPHLYIPNVYKRLSHPQLLIMEQVVGVKIDQNEQLRAWGISPETMVERGMEIYLQMIFEKGFFHADPHPGNIWVRKDGKIILLDFGMVGHLLPKDKYAFAGVLIAIANQDVKTAADQMRKLALSDQITDVRAFEYEVKDLVDDFSTLEVGEGSIAEMIVRLQKIMFTYKIIAPPDIYIIFRALTILEGVAKKCIPILKRTNM